MGLIDKINEFKKNLKMADETTPVQNQPDILRNFRVCFDYTLSNECSPKDYRSDTKGDAGGRTVCGIAASSHPDDVNIMWNMNYNDAVVYAKKIYYKEYWLTTSCDKIEDIHYCLVKFDCAINNGINLANKLAIDNTTVDSFCDARVKKLKDAYPNGYILDKGLPTQRDILPSLIARVERTRNWSDTNV
jgi:hypothetical protein